MSSKTHSLFNSKLIPRLFFLAIFLSLSFTIGQLLKNNLVKSNKNFIVNLKRAYGEKFFSHTASQPSKFSTLNFLPTHSKPSSTSYTSHQLSKRIPRINNATLFPWIRNVNLFQKIFHENPDPAKKYFLPRNSVSFKRIARFAIDTSYAYCTSHNEIGALLKRSEVKADVFRDQKTKNIIVFFKGAIYNLDQWKTRTICLTQYPEPQNAKMWKWDPKNLVDERWLQDVETMKPRLFEKIWKMVKFANRITPYSAERLHFVGHGIGGAYAVLAGLAFKLKYHTISPLGTRNPNSVHAVAVTFGQPRLGNRYFAEFVDEVITVVRITHTNDYVPRFPPKKNTFQHSGSEFWLSNESCDCPGPDSGYDSQKDYESYGLYYCPRGTDKSENKLCNAGQEIEEIQSKSAHLGPYVNIVMGDCSKNPEVAQFLDT